MKQFGLIKEISLEDELSWRDKIFITLDIDWAHDEVIRYVAKLLSDNNVKATWFVTHQTPVLNELRANPLFELGIHPNYNPLLLNGSAEKGNTAKDILDNVISIVPEAGSVRSHCLTQNTSLVTYYNEHKISKELNMLIPIQSGIVVKPFKDCSHLIQLPHIWEDDVHMLYKCDYLDMLKQINEYSGLTILDFHPIHVYLNETTFQHYQEAKPNLQTISKLIECVNTSTFGTKDFLVKLINHHK